MTTNFTRLALALALSGATLSCASCDQPSKPIGEIGDPKNGECGAELDGSLACYAATQDPYLALCDNPLAKEYWALFTRDDGTSAYFLPRPDEAGLTYGLCDGEDAELAALLEDNALCTSIDSPAKVEIINNIEPADALKISRALHERLEFTAVTYDEGEAGIVPFALPADLARVCDEQAEGLAAIAETCARLIAAGTEPSCNNAGPLGMTLTQAEAGLLADALNTLYGIE
ncbi:MAG: hypothetical protein H6713_23795 [Myxococcales bacterium]|nr:hypothetical protein [Myxococcales bacterium]